jgi:hypothetical protein
MTTEPTRRAPEEINRLLAEVAGVWRTRGLRSDAECMTVLARAGGFAGWSYRITREQRHGLIDCSSLVSQSTWFGAALGTPFVAETQRIAYNATHIDPTAVDDWLPGDVLVRHPSSDEAPGGRHNHVALFAGRDAGGRPWLVESLESSGVRAVSVDDGATGGGVRRFLRNPEVAFPSTREALRLARAVPKLGRLGARLTAKLTDPPRHHGVDVYFDSPVLVSAPISGSLMIEPLRAGAPHMQRVTVVSRCDAVVMQPLTLSGSIHQMTEIASGEPIGVLARTPYAGCNTLPLLRNHARLHLEYWSSTALGYANERGLEPPQTISSAAADMHAFNALYAMKLGIIGSPIQSKDVDKAIQLPAR